MMRTIRVDLGPRSYPIYIGAGLLEQLGALYRDHGLGSPAVIITDENVAQFHLASAERSLSRAGITTDVIVIPPGERSKDLRTANRIFGQLVEKGLTRESTIVALGGGVVGDVAGFVAANFLRGVALVQVPTTLLAQVDSSVGGKVGVNHQQGKNLIGTFWQPRFVLVDSETLKTLPIRELRSGLAEVIKYALIRDESLLALLEDRLEELLPAAQTNQPLIETIVARCCAIKSLIVAQDETERDQRRLLNFGHTIGHALEAALEYRLRHGEAVAWGMQAAAQLSEAKGLLSSSEHLRIARLITRLGCPRPGAVDLDLVQRKIRLDKKVRDGKIHFVLLSAIGEAVIRNDVSEAEIADALAAIEGEGVEACSTSW
jgi:3-dehydroquinate synthase